jgi:hypothetical protein
MTTTPSIPPTTPSIPPTTPLSRSTAHISSPLDRLELRTVLDGELVLPVEPGWDMARAAWHLTVDQRPEFVALPETVDDIVAITRYAASNGLRIAAQRTGHGAPAMEDLTDTILLKTSRMNAVEIDPVARRARVEAGALWQDVVPLAAEHGLAALHGSAPDIGVVGYSLGGGIGWLARRYGLASNSVLAAEVVTPDGRLLRVDPDHHGELFWALRGGGGSFGIVTSLEFALYPVREVYAGVLFFPLERAREVLHAWLAWTGNVSDSVTSVGRMLRFPPLPDLPEFLRGRSFVVVEACFLDGEAAARGSLQPLRDLGAEIDTFATMPVTKLPELHMDPPEPVPAIVDHRLVATMPPAAIDAIVDAAGPSVDSPLLSVEIRHLGGALRISDTDHGVLDRVDADYVLAAVGMPITPELGLAIEAHLDAVTSAVEPWNTGREYLNFAERPTTPDKLFGNVDAERLAAIAAAYDPHARMVANHPMQPPGATAPTE